jgi:hypothetical protein
MIGLFKLFSKKIKNKANENITAIKNYNVITLRFPTDIYLEV